jgi:ferrochelatase
MENNTGIVLLNLGSPESPSVPDVRKYLKEFLMDEKVIDIPFIARFLLVNGIIAPFRAPKSAEAYKTVWTDKGSPLKVITENFTKALNKISDIPAVYCMRYGFPKPHNAVEELEKLVPNLSRILLVPMYPHYAMSSYESAVESFKKYLTSHKNNISVSVLKPYYSEPSYISSLEESINPFLNDDFDAYLFSYHGLPIRHLQKSDKTKNHCYLQNNCCEVKSEAWENCYKHQVITTTNLVAKNLKINPEKLKISFQSRLGKGWIEPYTDKFFEEFPKNNIKKLLVVCPAFTSDCLETLEEINIRGKEIFMQNGGEKFVAVPCLNTLPKWVETIANYCKENSTSYANMWTK